MSLDILVFRCSVIFIDQVLDDAWTGDSLRRTRGGLDIGQGKIHAAGDYSILIIIHVRREDSLAGGN